MATQITATLPTLDFPREVDYPTQEDWAAFSAAAELNFGILGNGWSTQMQNWKDQANAMSIELNNNADLAQSIANYQGDWISQGYTLGQTVSVSGVYYICKLTHITGQNPTTIDSLYWNIALGNWNLKVDTNISGYASKTTPVDSDLIPLSDSVSSFGIKKLSWANLKATLKTYFDTLYVALSGNQTIAGIKTFTSSPIVPTPTTTGNVITMDNIIQKTAVGIGYGNGSGSSVIQLTNKNTSVLCSTPTGTIITSNSALSAGATAQFSVACHLVEEHDTIQINCKYSGAIGVGYDVNAVSNNGDFLIQLKNKDTITRTDNVYITYTVLKGSLV